MIRDIIDLHAVAGTFSYSDLENLARRHDPDLDLEAMLDHLVCGVDGTKCVVIACTLDGGSTHRYHR